MDVWRLSTFDAVFMHMYLSMFWYAFVSYYQDRFQNLIFAAFLPCLYVFCLFFNYLGSCILFCNWINLISCGFVLFGCVHFLRLWYLWVFRFKSVNWLVYNEEKNPILSCFCRCLFSIGFIVLLALFDVGFLCCHLIYI